MNPLRLFRYLCLLTLAAGPALAQQPNVALIVNAASNVRPGLPNSPIAEGAMFVIYGSTLGPSNIVVANSFPLKTDLAGTSIKVTVGSTTVNAIMYYTLATQVAAILPSSTPPGSGTLTVTYNGQTSAAAPIVVVRNNIGLFTINQAGSGEGVVTLADYSYVSATNAANPGEVVILWATGLGPVTFDETQAAPGGDLTNVPLEVFIGGKPATVLYRGRNTCCSSLDQINVQVPPGVTGCVVPITLKIGNLVSNTETMAVAAGGRQCTPTNPGVSQADLQRLLAKGSYTAGGIALVRTSTTTTTNIPPLPPTTTVTKSDVGGASFFKISGNATAAFNSQIDVTTFGSCVVSTFSGQGANPLAGLTVQSLDAGASLGVSGPSGSRTLPKQTAGGFIIYSATLGDATPGNYIDLGQYTVTGNGGADIGSFTARITVPPALVWTNQASITSVTRANGQTVTWTGGDPAGYVTITGTSFVGTSATSFVGATFTCTAKTSDGSFTVPAVVLLALPASGSITSGTIAVPIPGTLGITGAGATTAFQATGLDIGGASSQVSIFQTVTYQ
ncbi:MAG: hypothetical protein HY238_13310 [Acidobacteria bacterium]|nr:hypothetical protein [Acidobacteriota bacterium]